jgi:putative transposase
MARLPRLALPGCVHHIVQRGNNGQPIVVTDADRQLLLSLLEEHSRRLKVAVHAYVLTNDSLQLLATPESADGLPQLMQSIGRRYVRLFNSAHGRTGTLWEGRYRSTVIQPERHLLDCMTFMDWRPVHANLVREPAQHAWSSHGHYTGARADKLITPHAVYWTLGNTPFSRELAYSQRVAAGLSTTVESAIAGSTRGWALGDEAFVQALQKLTERRLVQGKAGRPRKSKLVESVPK